MTEQYRPPTENAIREPASTPVVLGKVTYMRGPRKGILPEPAENGNPVELFTRVIPNARRI